MDIVPKKSTTQRGQAPEDAKVRRITSGKRGGRQTSIGYDPGDREEHYARGSLAEFNVFGLETGGGYSPERFYTRSVNKDGHGEKMNIRVPQGLDTQMHKAVADHPQYHTMHDFIRDAVVHRLEYLQHHHGISPETEAMLQIERLRADDQREDQIIETMRDAVRDLDESLRFAWESGDVAMFMQKLDRGSLLVDQMRSPWKQQAGEMLKKWRATGTEKARRWRAEQEDQT